jgi:hypothetical protein
MSGALAFIFVTVGDVNKLELRFLLVFSKFN